MSLDISTLFTEGSAPFVVLDTSLIFFLWGRQVACSHPSTELLGGRQRELRPEPTLNSVSLSRNAKDETEKPMHREMYNWQSPLHHWILSLWLRSNNLSAISISQKGKSSLGRVSKFTQLNISRARFKILIF